jgi:transcriptional antiterminator NusG
MSESFDGAVKVRGGDSPVWTRFAGAEQLGGARSWRPPAGPLYDTGACWYALWTRSRHEKRVRDRLGDLGVEIFLPTIVRWSYWKDRKKQIDWPLFPGYCFARFSIMEISPVRACDGVVSIVGVNGEPSPVPDHEIEDVRRLLDSELAADPCPLVKEGAPVVVIHGPLKGVIGRLIRKGPQARLVISIELIGRALSVQVHAADVRPA